jgi:hypothetical protein
MAQQASPNPSGQMEDFRPQLTTFSTEVKKMFSFSSDANSSAAFPSGTVSMRLGFIPIATLLS